MSGETYIKQIRTLSAEHEKVKKTILSMCDDLDKEKDFAKKEIIKKSIEKTREKLTEIEDTCTLILEKIQQQYGII